MYKKGDKVIIRDDLHVGSLYGNRSFTLDMAIFLGKTVTIAGAHKKYYKIEEDQGGWLWTDLMIKGLATEPTQDKLAKAKADLEATTRYIADLEEAFRQEQLAKLKFKVEDVVTSGYSNFKITSINLDDEYYVTSKGIIPFSFEDQLTIVEPWSHSKVELTKEAEKQLAITNKLLAYKSEFDADFIPKDGQTAYYIFKEREKWEAWVINLSVYIPSIVLFSKDAATGLVRKLNLGEITL